jgi:hypothetical protein
MNKDLDHLFEQARKSMQSEMPLETVQGLIHGQASPSLWTKKTTWIMSTSIIGILTISIFCWFNNYNHPTLIKETETSKKALFTLQETASKPHILTIQNTKPDNIPLPVLSEETIAANPALLASSDKEPSKTNLAPKKATKLDSLVPKKTFTEYKLEIKKENSEQEIKKLKSELSNYGIHMDVQILDYDTNNKIKRFKGQFKTDSLFCGSTMNDYQFDISGAFKSMAFIFRVADNKDLKYLKIQSENFEETIECYDDEVISNTQEARKISRQIQQEIAIAQREMDKSQKEMATAQIEMANVQQEIARAQKELNQFREERHTKDEIKHLERRLEKNALINWDKIEADIEKAMKNVEIGLEDVNEDLMKTLENMEVILLDKNFKEDMKILQKDLAKMRLDIEREVIDQVKKNRLGERENERTIIERNHRSSDSNARERTATELKEEAASMEETAKELKRAAKEKRKMAKKKAKENSH